MTTIVVQPSERIGRTLEFAKEGCGLAARMAAEQLGCDIVILPDERPWKEVRDEMYDEVLDRMDKRCRIGAFV